MATTQRFIAGSFLMGLIALTSGCIVTPREGYYDRDHLREGYYDRDHHRYYRDRAWHECVEHDGYYCR